MYRIRYLIYTCTDIDALLMQIKSALRDRASDTNVVVEVGLAQLISVFRREHARPEYSIPSLTYPTARNLTARA